VKPTVGRMVLYVLTAPDAEQINRRRSDASDFSRDIASAEFSAVPVIGFGNQASEGDVCPATVVRVSDRSGSIVNLQVHLDGNDTYWATSRTEGDGPGTWLWPVIARQPGDRPPRH
jgi:hypothetical protein